MSNLTGKTLLNRYHVQKFLGRGGMAEVYKVWDSQRMTSVAMKALLEDLALDRIFIRRFTREANTLAKLQHPNIVRFYGFEQQDRLAFMLMDYIEGETLKYFIYDVDGKSMPYGQIRVITRSVCGALHYAHTQNLIHCDIKPTNIMIDLQGNVRLADFGIARTADEATATMVGAGTPAYMAPEQIRGQNPVRQTDIYALGVVLYEMFTGGERPFTGDQAQITGGTGEKVRWEHLHLPPPSPRAWNSSLSPKIEAVILKCLAKEPSERYARALNLVNALELALGDVQDEIPVVPPQSSPAVDERAAMPARVMQAGKKKNWLIAGVVAVLLLFSWVIGGKALNAPDSVAPVLQTQTPTITLPSETIATLTLTKEPSPTPEATQTPSASSLLGSGKTQLTFGDRDYYMPILSPDQSRMVAFAKYGDVWQLVEVDPNGGGLVRRITSANANYYHPHFSKDGDSILLASNFDGAYNIYLVSFETGEVIAQLTDDPATDLTPYWMPDEQSFVFMSKRDGDFEIYLGFVDGSPPQKLTNNTAYDGTSAVSPNGRKIAFYSDRNGNADIYVLDMSSNKVTQLTFSSGRDAEPAFSPNGEWIAFESDRGGNYDIWVVRPDGSGLHQVTSGAASNQVPSFSPDGKWLFHQSHNGSVYDLYRVPFS